MKINIKLFIFLSYDEDINKKYNKRIFFICVLLLKIFDI